MKLNRSLEPASQAIVLVLYFVVLTEPASLNTMKTQSNPFHFVLLLNPFPARKFLFFFPRILNPEFHRAMGLQIHPRSGYCSSNKTYYSKRKPVDFPQDEYLELPTYVSSLRHNGRIALIDSATGETTTFPQLWQSVRSLAAGLAGLGIRKSDVVLILSPNSIYFPIICMAILSIGAIVTTTNPLNTAAEVAKQARDSAAVLAFATPSLAVKLAATKLPIVLISSSSSELASQNDQNDISTLHSSWLRILPMSLLLKSGKTILPHCSIPPGLLE